MAKSFFEKLGHSLKLEEDNEELSDFSESPGGQESEYTSDEKIEDELPADAESDSADAELGSDEVQPQDEADANTIVTLAAAGKKIEPEKSKKRKMATKPNHRRRRGPAESGGKTIERETVAEEGQLTLDVYETEDEIVIKSTIAGVESDELDINITKDSVSIRGIRESDEEISSQDYFYQECYWGAFSRQVMLPSEIDPDKAAASLKNGILTIRLPKLSKTQHKKLKVNME